MASSSVARSPAARLRPACVAAVAAERIGTWLCWISRALRELVGSTCAAVGVRDLQPGRLRPCWPVCADAARRSGARAGGAEPTGGKASQASARPTIAARRDARATGRAPGRAARTICGPTTCPGAATRCSPPSTRRSPSTSSIVEQGRLAGHSRPPHDARRRRRRARAAAAPAPAHAAATSAPRVRILQLYSFDSELDDGRAPLPGAATACAPSGPRRSADARRRSTSPPRSASRSCSSTSAASAS